jgi:hypothetical protein
LDPPDDQKKFSIFNHHQPKVATLTMTTPAMRYERARVLAGKSVRGKRHPADVARDATQANLFGPRDLAAHGNEKFNSPAYASHRMGTALVHGQGGSMGGARRGMEIGGASLESRQSSGSRSGSSGGGRVGGKRRLTKAERKRAAKLRKKGAQRQRAASKEHDPDKDDAASMGVSKEMARSMHRDYTEGHAPESEQDRINLQHAQRRIREVQEMVAAAMAAEREEIAAAEAKVRAQLEEEAALEAEEEAAERAADAAERTRGVARAEEEDEALEKGEHAQEAEIPNSAEEDDDDARGDEEAETQTPEEDPEEAPTEAAPVVASASSAPLHEPGCPAVRSRIFVCTCAR